MGGARQGAALQAWPPERRHHTLARPLNKPLCPARPPARRTLLLGTKVCPLDWKNSLKVERTREAGHCSTGRRAQRGRGSGWSPAQASGAPRRQLLQGAVTAHTAHTARHTACAVAVHKPRTTVRSSGWQPTRPPVCCCQGRRSLPLSRPAPFRAAPGAAQPQPGGPGPPPPHALISPGAVAQRGGYLSPQLLPDALSAAPGPTHLHAAHRHARPAAQGKGEPHILCKPGPALQPGSTRTTAEARGPLGALLAGSPAGQVQHPAQACAARWNCQQRSARWSCFFDQALHLLAAPQPRARAEQAADGRGRRLWGRLCRWRGVSVSMLLWPAPAMHDPTMARALHLITAAPGRAAQVWGRGVRGGGPGGGVWGGGGAVRPGAAGV